MAMAAAVPPADLKVLCKKLTASNPADLPALCPILVNHVLRCGGPLSMPAEQHVKNGGETSTLVHKLKTQVNTLLRGRSPQGRFAGMVLAKAILDIGGWECLRTCKPWVDGLLPLLQRSDPSASKELCLAVLVRIYTLLHEYPTLVREIATPTLQTFATACLQLLRQDASAKLSKAPLSTVETTARALSSLLPLYPTTLRPFAGQIKSAARRFIAPTSADSSPIIPSSLSQSSRRLVILLHYTAPKNGNAEEWRKQIDSFVRETHSTADWVFRAVRESRDSGSGYASTEVSYEGAPHGGSDEPEELPAWTGIQSGAERLVGLIESIAESFRCPTKTPVGIPLGDVTNLVSRISMVLPPSPGTADRDAASLMNPSIGREEREELWGALPEIHLATLRLLEAVTTRLGAHVVPLGPSMLEDAMRLFTANSASPKAREAIFSLVGELLPLLGTSLERLTVDSLTPVVHGCCQDVLTASGFASPEKKDDTVTMAAGGRGTNGAKRRAPTTNADLFRIPGANKGGEDAPGGQGGAAAAVTRLAPSHLQAAERLLSTLITYLPQEHVKKADRALLDRTAILSANKAAMLASVLHPYVDQSGRYFANTIPFLSRAYPCDVDVEVLRSNLRTAPHYFGNVFGSDNGPGDDEASDDDDDDASMADVDGAPTEQTRFGATVPSSLPTFFETKEKTGEKEGEKEKAVKDKTAPAFEPLTLKRKPEAEAAEESPKRLDTGKISSASEDLPMRVSATAEKEAKDEDDDDDDSDGSVQLDMALDDDLDSEEEA